MTPAVIIHRGGHISGALHPNLILCLFALLGSYLVRPALMAHGDIAVVAAEEHLIALRYDAPVLADAGVDRRLVSLYTREPNKLPQNA